MIITKSNDNFLKNESGAVAIITALVLLFVVIGIAALAIDIGKQATASNELQNAVDAAALAGAKELALKEYNFTDIETAANAVATMNKVDNKQLVLNTSSYSEEDELILGDIETGYLSSLSNPLPSLISPPSGENYNAVKVTVNNHGISSFFGQILGINQSVSAESIAVTPPASAVGEGQVFPVAIHKEFLDLFLDSGIGTFVVVSSAYHSDDPGEAGQWTSLFTEDNDRPTTRDLINLGNPDPISKGDDIYIQPGTMTALYNDTASWLQNSPTVDELGNPYRDVVMPVVEGDIDNKSTKEWREVVGFVGIRITSAKGGSDKIIEGNFTNVLISGGPGGPEDNYGVFTIVLVK